MDKLYVSEAEAAEIMGWPLRTLASWRRRRAGPRCTPVRGHGFVYRRADIAAFLAELDGDVPPSTAPPRTPAPRVIDGGQGTLH